MCGRYALFSDPERIRVHFGLREVPPLPPRYNIAPSQEVPGVRHREERELAMLRWGLIPSWAKDIKTGYRMVNARAETVAQRPAFRAAFRRRRCLLPADGFYEWQARGRYKQPYFIRRKDGDLMAFAGLWEHWEGEGEVIESCTLIVTDANPLLRPIHDRMPVIIDRADYDRWLLPTEDFAGLLALLRPYPEGALEAYPVSPYVNNPRHDDPRCIEPITAGG